LIALGALGFLRTTIPIEEHIRLRDTVLWSGTSVTYEEEDKWGNRRKFLQGIAAVSGAAVLSKFGDLPTANALVQQEELLAARVLPAPSQSGIDHIVVVMMETAASTTCSDGIRGADGKQAGLTYNDPSGIPHSTQPIWRATLRVADIPTRTIRMRAGVFNMTSADGWIFARRPK